MKYNIILASNSPRRSELLAGLDISFEVRVNPGINEKYPEEIPAEEIPLYIAKKKAASYIISNNELLITADTIVLCENEVLGKPKDAHDASRMLHLLSGKVHRVVTGVCLTTTVRQQQFAVCTEVIFKKLTDKEITYYIENHNPFDKAGAYGIQDWIGYIGVTSIKGSYFNVVGLPVQRIYEELKKFE